MTNENQGSDTNRGVIETDRPAGAIYNGCACTVLRDVSRETDGSVFTDKRDQVLCLVDDREVYFYADEIKIDEEAAKAAKLRPDYLPENLRRHAATSDQAAWDAASMNPTVQSMEQYLLAYPMGTHAMEARARRSQIAPGLPALPPLPQAMTDNMPGQAPMRAKDEERGGAQGSMNHPEYGAGAGSPPRSVPRGIGGQPLPQSGQNQNVGAAEAAAWSEVSETNTVWAYDDYLARYPEGVYAAQAKENKAKLTG